MLLLHGFLGSHRNLGALVRGWTAKDPTIRPISIDLLGHGQAPPLPPNAGLETMALAVLEQVTRLGLEEPVPVVGHSLGGRVSLMAKRLAPGVLAPIALLDITPSPIRRRANDLIGVAGALLSAPESAPTRDAMRAHLSRTLSPSIVEWLAMNLTRANGEFRWSIDRHALAELDQRASEEDLWDTIDDTVLCLRGQDSPYVSGDDVRRFEALGARVVTVPDAGHFVHVDQTEAVVDLLLEFFERCSRR